MEFVAPEILVPFFSHWCVGALPPLVPVAVNVTLVPVQTAPEGLAAMLVLTGCDEEIDIVILLDVAGTGDAHVTELVSVHVITSPSARAEEV